MAALSIENKLEKIITSTPDWEVSKHLQVCRVEAYISSAQSNSFQQNIDSYVIAVLLCKDLLSYKGETPTNHVLVSGFLSQLILSTQTFVVEGIVEEEAFRHAPGYRERCRKLEETHASCPGERNEQAIGLEEIGASFNITRNLCIVTNYTAAQTEYSK